MFAYKLTVLLGSLSDALPLPGIRVNQHRQTGNCSSLHLKEVREFKP